VLNWKGFQVRHVVNITDVGHLTSDADVGDDKLELAARREHQTAWEIAARYTADFKADLGRLRIIEPDVWCKATDHIPQMIRFAEALEAGGFCYRLPSGLYFDALASPGYGTLARLDVAGQQAGARVEVVEGKRNPADFAVFASRGWTEAEWSAACTCPRARPGQARSPASACRRSAAISSCHRSAAARRTAADTPTTPEPVPDHPGRLQNRDARDHLPDHGITPPADGKPARAAVSACLSRTAATNHRPFRSAAVP
jgi:hypothetical protein